MIQDVEADYTKKGRVICINNKLTGEIRLESVTPARSKPLIDRSDIVLAKYIGFTPEELDYVTNYDIKYRMGLSACVAQAGRDGGSEEEE